MSILSLFVSWIMWTPSLCSPVMQPGDDPADRQIIVEWPDGRVGGTVVVRNGTLRSMRFARGGMIDGRAFDSDGKPDIRLLLSLADVRVDAGSGPTMITVRTDEHPFSFLLRDVSTRYPIFIPGYRVAVTCSGDTRSYTQI
ncbi:MAG TPA: hypothetical protein VL126_06475, partial [Bacteroidota bacterium]|nr:hypothetical protein [Bacteroidota bacterium]